MPYVLSTATCPQKFCEYSQAVPGSPHAIVRSVLIRGGANAPSAKSGFGEVSNLESGQPIWTPSGVVTKIDAEEEKLLLSNETFLTGVKGGFYQILKDNPGDSHTKVKDIVEKSMTKRDSSAPMTKETAKTQIKVTTKLDTTDE